MKRVLIIVYYWPPTGGSGVQRWVKFVKHLRRFGWEPVIYTPENPAVNEFDKSLLQEIPENITVLRQPVFELSRWFGAAPGSNSGNQQPTQLSKIKRAVGNFIRGNLFIPDPRALWVKPSVNYLRDYLKENPVSAIISSGPPHSMHLIALQISRQLNIPWLADFRDPWMEILDFHGFNVSDWAREQHKKLFSSVLQNANEIVVAHRSVQQNFSGLTKKPVTLITNGYDAEDITTATLPPIEAGTFRIVFVGILYNKLNSTALWQAIRKVSATNTEFANTFRLIFVGKVESEALKDLAEQCLIENCEFTGYVDHRTAVGYEKSADLLLLLTPPQPDFKYVIPGKLFEYMAVEKPVLCLGQPDNDSALILAESGYGKTAHPGSVDDIAKALHELFDNRKHPPAPPTHGANYSLYERKQLTEKLVKVLNRISPQNEL